MARMIWWWSVTTLFFSVIAVRGDHGDLEEQLRVLSKQVTALLDRRSEDLKSIEDDMRRKLSQSQDLTDVKEEIKSLREEIVLLRGGNVHTLPHHTQPHTTQDKNDHLTVKWLIGTVNELKTELSEIQTTVNSTVILQNHEKVDSEITLLKSDVLNFNKELETARSKNVKYEAELLEIREELGSLRDHSRATAVMCGKNKNQLKVAQLEWNYNWKTLNEKLSSGTNVHIEDIPQEHSSRHQRLLRKHLMEVQKTTKHLHKENEELRTKMLKMEEEIKILQNYKASSENNLVPGENIPGKNIKKYIALHELNEIDASASNDIPTTPTLLNLEQKIEYINKQQILNAGVIQNLTKQLSNSDKLHMSMLELLENVESIENKVDKNFPEFRKEISKLEIQLSETGSEIALLKEDQTNTRESVKAIGVSVSNLQDKFDGHQNKMKEINDTLVNLKKSTSTQTSKLHDHILKAESSQIDLNSTKSTIHLVEELKSFENEYKSIVNKLPHDCNAVLGPTGIYLISPGDGEPILAFCKDGWTTIQKRYDGSVDFNRKWNEYSNGFGSATGEHWLGNRNLHVLTKNNCTKLQINMKDIYGKYWQANYDEFNIGDYSTGFKLTVGKYHGNASDALDYQNRMEFSTIDNDRDISNTHCASNYEGGWWFSHCQHANLNGRYNLGLTWFDSSRNEWIAVATSELRIKQKENC